MKPIIFALALFSIAAVSHAQTTGNEVFNDRQPLAAFIVNPCSGEPIVYTGECHTIAHTRTSADGVRLDVHMNCHAEGEGALGNSYTFSSNTISRSDTPLTCGFTQRLTQRSRFITSRVTQNFFLTINFLVTTDENCQIHVVVDETDVDCRGRQGVF
jgi:hypothetical protein